MAETTERDVTEQAPQGAPDIDWKAESRKHERRAKENKALADQAVRELEELKASVAEQTRAKDAEEKSLTERLNEANERVKALEAKQERERLVRSIAAERSVDAELLLRMAGDTADEVTANAELVRKVVSEATRGRWEPVKDHGTQKAPRISKEEILAEKNPSKQLRLIAENKDLFK